MSVNRRGAIAAAAVAVVCSGVVACGNSVKGRTYKSDAAVFVITFQPDGKVVETMGLNSTNCTYMQDKQTITIFCGDLTTTLLLNPDGSLSGPPGMMAKLTRIK